MSRPAPDQPRPQSPQVAGSESIALDVGLSRIGVATCDPLRLSVRPLLTLTRQPPPDFARLAALSRSKKQSPSSAAAPNMDGSDSDQTRSVRKWAMRLAHALRLAWPPIPHHFWDERLSTYGATTAGRR